jgi:hypothetical protein
LEWIIDTPEEEHSMSDSSAMSRRDLLKRVAVLAGGAVVGAGMRVRNAAAQQKATKEAMKYQDKPKGDQQCSNCAQFVPPDGCKVVQGSISPQGYCIAWVKKA